MTTFKLDGTRPEDNEELINGTNHAVSPLLPSSQASVGRNLPLYVSLLQQFCPFPLVEQV